MVFPDPFAGRESSSARRPSTVDKRSLASKGPDEPQRVLSGETAATDKISNVKRDETEQQRQDSLQEEVRDDAARLEAETHDPIMDAREAPAVPSLALMDGSSDEAESEDEEIIIEAEFETVLEEDFEFAKSQHDVGGIEVELDNASLTHAYDDEIEEMLASKNVEPVSPRGSDLDKSLVVDMVSESVDADSDIESDDDEKAGKAAEKPTIQSDSTTASDKPFDESSAKAISCQGTTSDPPASADEDSCVESDQFDEEPGQSPYPTTLAAEGTWSFDSMLHRKKTPAKSTRKKKKTQVIEPVEEAPKSVAEKTTPSVVAEEKALVGDAVDENVGKSSDSSDAGSEASRSGDFDSDLEKLVESLESGDWDKFVAAIQERPSLAALSASEILPVSNAELSSFIDEDAKRNPLLHEVCKNEPTAIAVQTLIDLHESAIKTQGQFGYLPLHFACAFGASHQVIETLVKAYPIGVATTGNDLAYPLHLACKRGLSEETIALLLREYLPASGSQDADKNMPVDYALTHPDKSVKERMLKAIYSNTETNFNSMDTSVYSLQKKLNKEMDHSGSLEVQLEQERKKAVALEEQLKQQRSKSAFLGEEMKQQFEHLREKVGPLDLQLKEERKAKSDLEAQLNCEREKAAALERMLKEQREKVEEGKYVQSIPVGDELGAERIRVAQLESQLKNEQGRATLLETELGQQVSKASELEVELRDEREKTCVLESELSRERGLQESLSQLEQTNSRLEKDHLTIQDKCENLEGELNDARVQLLLEKQQLYEKADKQLAKAYKIIEETAAARNTFGSMEEELLASKSVWLVEKQTIYEKANRQLAEAHLIINGIESDVAANKEQWLMTRQALYERMDSMLGKAYQIVLEVEDKAQQDRERWLLERQALYEKAGKDLASAFDIVSETEMELKVEQIKRQEFEDLWEEREGVSGQDVSRAIGETLTDESDDIKKSRATLTHEESLVEQVEITIARKKQLMQENQEVIRLLEKSNEMKQTLLDAQQKKVEDLEQGRRQKEQQLKMHQEVVKELEKTLSQRKALEQEEAEKVSKLEQSREARKSALTTEEDQVRELDFTLARKQALIELEKMKEKTLEQTMAQKNELIQAEVARIKELEKIIAEKNLLLVDERNTIKHLEMAKVEKEAILASEKSLISDIRKAQQEKEELLEAQRKTDAEIQAKIKENENLLAAEQSAVEHVKKVQTEKESMLKVQQATVEEAERQVARRESLMKREEYIGRILETYAARKRNMLKNGYTSYFVNATINAKFILKEAFLASSYEKSQIREQSARRNRELVISNSNNHPYASLIVKGPSLLVSGIMQGLGLRKSS